MAEILYDIEEVRALAQKAKAEFQEVQESEKKSQAVFLEVAEESGLKSLKDAAEINGQNTIAFGKASEEIIEVLTILEKECDQLEELNA